MAEFVYNDRQIVNANQPVVLRTSIPCNKGYVFHRNESGIITLRGIVNNVNACFARYQVTFNGNIALPEGATVVPIAIALTVNGEPRLTSRAIFTPAAAEEYGNVTSTAIIKVPKGCCFSLGVEVVPATTDPTVTPAPIVDVQNANLTIARIA